MPLVRWNYLGVLFHNRKKWMRMRCYLEYLKLSRKISRKSISMVQALLCMLKTNPQEEWALTTPGKTRSTSSTRKASLHQQIQWLSVKTNEIRTKRLKNSKVGQHPRIANSVIRTEHFHRTISLLDRSTPRRHSLTRTT